VSGYLRLWRSLAADASTSPTNLSEATDYKATSRRKVESAIGNLRTAGGNQQEAAEHTSTAITYDFEEAFWHFDFIAHSAP